MLTLAIILYGIFCTYTAFIMLGQLIFLSAPDITDVKLGPIILHAIVLASTWAAAYMALLFHEARVS